MRQHTSKPLPNHFQTTFKTQLYELACQLYSDVDDLGPQSTDGSSDGAWRSEWHRFVSELASETGLSGRTVRWCRTTNTTMPMPPQGLFDMAAQRYRDYQERTRLAELQELLASANVATRPATTWQPIRVDTTAADSGLGMDMPPRRMPLVQPSRVVMRASRGAVSKAQQGTEDGEDTKTQMMPNMRNEIDAW